MKNLYLLATSLLIGLTIPTSVFTKLPSLQPEHYQLLLNRKDGWQKTKLEDTASASDSVPPPFSSPA
ncbi:MAG: lipolytic protein G-D-S-L family, partial [Rivularia sp. ALOHA_DT_140]|nr:lipolytic protein G-D-S-L family [Rivularia sp. ALOHA_DT_140]